MFHNQYCSIQIDYSVSKYVKDEDAYHMMPLLSYTTLAVHNFMEWIGVKHFVLLSEDLPEFHAYPRPNLDHLVNS